MLSRQRSRSKSEGGKTDEKRSGSKDDRKEFKNCIAYNCNECIKMGKCAKEFNVQLCDEYDLSEESDDIGFRSSCEFGRK